MVVRMANYTIYVEQLAMLHESTLWNSVFVDIQGKCIQREKGIQAFLFSPKSLLYWWIWYRCCTYTHPNAHGSLFILKYSTLTHVLICLITMEGHVVPKFSEHRKADKHWKQSENWYHSRPESKVKQWSPIIFDALSTYTDDYPRDADQYAIDKMAQCTARRICQRKVYRSHWQNPSCLEQHRSFKTY